MTIRLYFDEDSSDTDLLKALRLRGIDVLGAPECGMLAASDAEQIRWATGHQRVLVSSNRSDFYRIHSDLMRTGHTHSGIILGVQQRYSLGDQMRRLLRLVAAKSAEDMRNHIEFLSAWG